MEVGDRVRTTGRWGREFANGKSFTGRIVAILDAPALGPRPNRTHIVKMDEPVADFLSVLKFDPIDIERIL